MNDDDVVPRYLVLVNERVWGPEFDSEAEAIEYAEQPPPNNRFRSIEVVRSVLRLEIDSETGEMLLVGEKLKEQPATRIEDSASCSGFTAAGPDIKFNWNP